ncbi:opsin-1-like [Aricia agestis]|uniref:opsin-1-like n=1 Tax=Aricia agestis TaxID=91739 RepID=UPI001C20A6FB|nr:opsin-1-like [Aricia agestis]XP_041974749.1 opsin-1-like [Aricia agestis]XP_041974751.1 opsin-1-like [Aricia agestis]
MTIMNLDPAPGVAALQSWGPQASALFNNETVVDKVLPEMLHRIDPHWYQFPPMNPLWHAILAFITSVILIIASTGNGMVIYIFTTTKTLKTPSNLFIVNLALSDFLIITTMSPPVVVNTYYETWIFGPLACDIYACCGSLFGCVSIWSMTMIAFDRYNVIVKGIAAKPLTNGGALLRILGIWLFSLAWTITPLFGWGKYAPEGNMCVCGTDYLDKSWVHRSYIILYSFACYFMPLFLIIYSYWFIIQAVSAHEKAMREQAKKMNVASLRSSDQANTSAECKLAKVALMTISLWFMAWTPYLIINFAGIFKTELISPLATIWGSVFAKANAIYNPIVYGISHPKYRAALYARFPALACQPSADESGSVASSGTAVQEEKPSA